MARSYFISLMIFASVFWACSKPTPECTDIRLLVTSLETRYDCSDTRYALLISLVDTFTIIRSQASFEALVSGNCIPTVDFALYDLVIGKKQLGNGNDSIGYTLKRWCKNDQLILTVRFYQNLTEMAPNITYHTLIPKLGDEESIKVITEIINQPL